MLVIFINLRTRLEECGDLVPGTADRLW